MNCFMVSACETVFKMSLENSSKLKSITIFQTDNANLPLYQDDTCTDLQVPGSIHIHETNLHNLDMAIPTHV